MCHRIRRIICRPVSYTHLDVYKRQALVLGSGLGGYAKKMQVVSEIAYKDIEGFPVSTVEGHDGRFLFGYVADVPVVLMKGRVHYYEGYDITEVVKMCIRDRPWTRHGC